MHQLISKLWYDNHPIRWVLMPFAWGFSTVTAVRRWYLQQFCQINYPIPVIVVGNLTVGGVGKTPLVIELAKRFNERGISTGIVSRGYGARVSSFPYEVRRDDSADRVGDEPLLMAQKTNCPVVIAPNRNQAVSYLLENKGCQVIISDDGLQHYRMGRSIEIAVIDGARGLGNGLCLPAGPLREKKHRLKQVDFIVVNQGQWPNAHPMQLNPGHITNLNTKEELHLEGIKDTIAAVAGIGNPQRFYSTLTQLGIKFNKYSYPDHYQFKADDLNYSENLVIMTEKDAVKCHAFHSDKLYYLPVEAVLNDVFWNALWSHQHLKGYFK